MRTLRRAAETEIEARPDRPLPVGGEHELLALQRRAGNAAVNEYLRRATSERDTSEEPDVDESDEPFDLVTTKELWIDRLQALEAQREVMGPPTITNDRVEIERLLGDWRNVPYKGKDFQHAMRLVKALEQSEDPEDVKLAKAVDNAVQQQDRQATIRKAMGALGSRDVLAVVAGGRLEAICIWEVVVGNGGADPATDANWWVGGWTSCFYIEELSTAPWNVGWDPDRPPVRGAGTALIDEAVRVAMAQQCDGIGLSALPSNVDFYRKVGFQPKRTNKLSMVRHLHGNQGCCVLF